ncbi:MAG: beta-lactamase family protein [Oscillospiraceae bacterium]|nr:beta-lactamase family protein [Oscillospiraceae bacterium]
MRNKVISALMLFALLAGLNTTVFALSDDQSTEIQLLLDEARRASGAGISVSILIEDDEFFFSSGYSNRRESILANETTLYELASVSKAFVGLGMLLLEDQGYLSMDDSIAKYLPWLTLRYEGRQIDMQEVTLNHFLHHTSGLVNSTHLQLIPSGDTLEMLQKTVDALINTELAFSPGERYEYGTVNYNVLGLVMEIVTGQDFESFMEEQIFRPLGLYQTFANMVSARATGQLAQGYRTSFFISMQYDAPDFRGNTPAGYIISSAHDMARWMGIQLGTVEDIPENFHSLIEMSHRGNQLVADVNGWRYAAGWQVNTDQAVIWHAGSNPAFSTNVALFLEDRIAIAVLSNSASTNIAILDSIKAILDGDNLQVYQMSFMRMIDVIFSCIAIIATLLAVMFFSLGMRRRKVNSKQSMTRKRWLLITIWLLIFIATTALCLIFPSLLGFDWFALFVWVPCSVPTALFALPILVASVIWFIYTHRHKMIK